MEAFQQLQLELLEFFCPSGPERPAGRMSAPKPQRTPPANTTWGGRRRSRSTSVRSSPRTPASSNARSGFRPSGAESRFGPTDPPHSPPRDHPEPRLRLPRNRTTLGQAPRRIPEPRQHRRRLLRRVLHGRRRGRRPRTPHPTGSWCSQRAPRGPRRGRHRRRLMSASYGPAVAPMKPLQLQADMGRNPEVTASADVQDRPPASTPTDSGPRPVGRIHPRLTRFPAPRPPSSPWARPCAATPGTPPRRPCRARRWTRRGARCRDGSAPHVLEAAGGERLHRDVLQPAPARSSSAGIEVRLMMSWVAEWLLNR